MSNKNKKVREQLEEIYGRKCMMHEGLKIKGFKFVEARYRGEKGKSIMQQLTLHHLKPLREDGSTTVENSAELCRGCHDFLEEVSEKQRAYLNNELIKYKRSIDGGELPVRIADYEPDFEVKAMVFEVPKQKYNRAKKKAEDRRLEEKYWEEQEC